MQTDKIVFLVDQKLRSDCRLIISALAYEFPHFGRTTVHTIVTEKLEYNKLYAKWVPKMLTVQHKAKNVIHKTAINAMTPPNCETLNKLRRAIQNQRRGKLSFGVILLHDKEHLYTAAKAQKKIKDFLLGAF